tara:strand:+ start:615 stop:872 length:258 start_codon:yes stop_codon:yes gene_type:complete
VIINIIASDVKGLQIKLSHVKPYMKHFFMLKVYMTVIKQLNNLLRERCMKTESYVALLRMTRFSEKKKGNKKIDVKKLRKQKVEY